MDPNIYWASMAAGQSIRYSAVSCQMTAVGPATSWAPTMPPGVTPYPHSAVPGPQLSPVSMHKPPPPGTLPLPVSMHVPLMPAPAPLMHNHHQDAMQGRNAAVATTTVAQLKAQFFVPPSTIQTVQPQRAQLQPTHYLPPQPGHYPPPQPAHVPLPQPTHIPPQPMPDFQDPVTPPEADATQSPKFKPMINTLASKLESKAALSSKVSENEIPRPVEMDDKFLTAASPVKAKAKSPPIHQEILEGDTELWESIYKKYEDLFREHGSMEPTDQRVLTMFIQLTKEERRVVMSCGSIKSFLCINPAFVLEGKLLHYKEDLFDRSHTADLSRDKGTSFSREELFALKAQKAGITVGSPKTSFLPRIPGDGQSDPTAEVCADSEDETDESDLEESPESPGLGETFSKLRKSLLSYLQEEDDQYIHTRRKHLQFAMNNFTAQGTDDERLEIMMSVKNSVIATKSFDICKTRIEEVSDIMNYFYSSHTKNNNDSDLSHRLEGLKLESNISGTANDRLDDRSEALSPTVTPDSPALPEVKLIASKLNVHSVEFVPRSPSISTSGDSSGSSPKISRDVSTNTAAASITEVATSTVGLISHCHRGTLTVFNSDDKNIQTEPLKENSGSNQANTVDEIQYEEVLYRAMIAEERVLHLQRDLNLMRAKSRIQEFQALMPSDKAKSNISFIKKEIARVEAVFDCNLSAVRDGVKLSDLPALILKPLPTCHEKQAKVTKGDDGDEADMETAETDSYITAKTDQTETDVCDPDEQSEEEHGGDIVNDQAKMQDAAAAADIPQLPGIAPEITQPFATAPEIPQPMVAQQDQPNVGGLDTVKLILKQNVIAMLTQINPMLATNPMLLEFIANQYLAQQNLSAGHSPNVQSLLGMMGGANILPTSMPTTVPSSVLNVPNLASTGPNSGLNPAVPPAMPPAMPPQMSGSGSTSPDYPALSVTPPLPGNSQPSKPPGLPSPTVSKVDSQGPPGLPSPEKKEMKGVASAMAIRKGRGRGRGTKKSGQPGVGGAGSNAGDDTSSLVSDQTSSVFQFGESGASEFTFRKNVKRVAMTRREKSVPAVSASDGSKRKIQDVQDKIAGWDFGSVLVSGDSGDSGYLKTDMKKDEVEQVQAVPDERGDMKPVRPMSALSERSAAASDDLAFARKSESPPVVTPPVVPPPVVPPPVVPPPVVLPAAEYIPRDAPITQTGCDEDWDEDAPEFGTAWKLSTFGPTILPNDSEKEMPVKSTVPPGLPQRSSWHQKPDSSNSLAAKLKNSKSKKVEPVTKTPVPPKPDPRGKQLPVVGSSVDTVPVVIFKTPAKTKATPQDKPKATPTPKKPEPQAWEMPKASKSEKPKKDASSVSGLDSFDVIVPPKPSVEDDSEWQQVCKKKKKVEACPSPALKPKAAALPKSQENFDKIINKILSVHTSMSRNDAIDVISEVRQVKGGLNGLKLSQIIEAANSIISSKKRNQCLFAHGKKELQVPPADLNIKMRRKSNSESSMPDVVSKPAASAAVKDPWNIKQPVEDFQCGEPCVICFGGIRPGFEEKLTCGHLFHQTCIKRWVVGEERTCPTCRSHVLLEEEFPALG